MFALPDEEPKAEYWNVSGDKRQRKTMDHFKVEAAVKAKDVEIKKGAGESVSPCFP